MGGNDVNGENIKNNDSLQLQQMIIFLKAELAKHKSEVKKYQDSYHYSVVENLEQENLQLTNEKKELAEELMKLNQEFEKRVSDYKGSVQLRGMLGKRYITSIDTFQKTNTELLPISKQLNEVINKLKDGVNTDQHRYKKHDRQVSSIHKKLANNKTTIEQLENKLVDLIQETNKQVHIQMEKLDRTNKVHAQYEKVRRHLIKEIEDKNSIIGKLQHEILDLKEQNEKQTEAIAIEEKNLTNKTTIAQLENKLVDFIQEENKQVHSHLEKLDIANKERSQSEKVRQRLLLEIEDKNNIIGKLQHEISNLKQQNDKRSEANAIEEKNLTNKATIAQLENKLVDFIQEENKQVHSHLKKLDIARKERAQSEKVRQRLLLEIKDKNSIIGKLQHEISNLKQQNNKHTEAIAVVEKELNQKNESREGPDSLSLISTTIIDSEELIQLDHQIKEVLAKSLDFEEKLDAKLLVINTLEHKLDQLTVEIDGIKVFSVEGRISKES